MHMNHRRRIPILAAALLVAATGVALAQQDTAPAQRNWFWSWFSSPPAPAPKPAKPAVQQPARVAAEQPAKPNNNCSFFKCIILVGVGF
jgi:hypothetical protein